MKRLIERINLKKIKSTIKGKRILLADRGRFESVFKNYSAIKILETKFKIEPIILTQIDLDDNVNLLYKKLGFKNFFKTGDKLNFGVKFIFVLRCFYEFIKCLKYFIKGNFYDFIYKYKINKINIGDIIYDRYIRDHQRYLNPNFFHGSFLKFFFITIFKTLYLNYYLKKNKIELIIVNTHSYANNYSIVFKLAKVLKIDLLYLKDFQISYFKKGQYSKEEDPRILTKKKMNKISLTKRKKNHLFNHMKKGVSGQLDHFDVKNAFGKKNTSINAFYKKNRIEMKNFRKKVLIASHALSDANHFYFEFDVKSPFFDNYTQLIKSLKFAKKNKDILFLLRPHPSSKFWQEDGVIKKILKKYSAKNILYVGNNFSTHDLLKSVDTVLTVYGTIGIELAGYYKKKPILAGTGVYSNLGFTLDTIKPNDYFKSILEDKSKHRLNLNEFKMAEKALYYFEIIVKKEYPSFINRTKTLIDDKNYLNDLIKFLKNNTFESDLYYKNLKSCLIKKFN